MATVTIYDAATPTVLLNTLGILQSAGANDPNISRGATAITVATAAVPAGGVTFAGTGFTFDAAGRPTGGTVTSVSEPFYRPPSSGTLAGSGITGIQVPLTTLYAAAAQNAAAALLPGLLGGGDTFQVSVPTGQTLSGYGGDDVFNVGLVALGGRPAVDGGAGIDTVATGRLRSDTTVAVQPGSLQVGTTGTGTAETYVSIEAIRFADGTLSFDPGTTGGQVYTLFSVAFGRAPGAGELGYFTDAARRYGLPATASGLLATPEGQARLGGLDDAGFVGAVYRAALGRDADSGGLQYWQGRLAAGDAGRGGVLAGIAATAEAKGRAAAALAPGVFGADPAAVAVERVFLAATGAPPTAAALANGVSQPLYGLETALAGQSVAAGLSNTEFVASLIRNAYGADASDPTAVAYYTQILNGAGAPAALIATRAAVLDAYASSPGIAARVAPYITDRGVLHA